MLLYCYSVVCSVIYLSTISPNIDTQQLHFISLFIFLNVYDFITYIEEKRYIPPPIFARPCIIVKYTKCTRVNINM